ncbi:MAG: hypothetical protein J7L42_00830 [Elusimicrobia bacterium]|nr:hypothetical protein [Elusimicrobiota bacterium]
MLSILGGLVAIVIAVLWIIPNNGFGFVGDDVLIVLKGGIALGLIFGGIIAIAAGISAIKEKAEEKKEEEALKKEEEVSSSEGSSQ